MEFELKKMRDLQHHIHLHLLHLSISQNNLKYLLIECWYLPLCLCAIKIENNFFSNSDKLSIYCVIPYFNFFYTPLCQSTLITQFKFNKAKFAYLFSSFPSSCLLLHLLACLLSWNIFSIPLWYNNIFMK